MPKKTEEEVRHLHRTNDLAFCGEDAAHILMTFKVGEETCEECKTAVEKYRDQIRIEIDRHDKDAKRLDEEKEALEETIKNAGEKLDENTVKMQSLHDALDRVRKDSMDITDQMNAAISSRQVNESAKGGLLHNKEILHNELLRVSESE